MIQVTQVAVCSQINTKHIIRCGQSVQLLSVKFFGAPPNYLALNLTTCIKVISEVHEGNMAKGIYSAHGAIKLIQTFTVQNE
jgi:hypothetical protein